MTSKLMGRRYIRNTPGSILARAVDAEFLVTHFIYFPAMEVLGGTGYFGGSKCAPAFHSKCTSISHAARARYSALCRVCS